MRHEMVEGGVFLCSTWYTGSSVFISAYFIFFRYYFNVSIRRVRLQLNSDSALLHSLPVQLERTKGQNVEHIAVGCRKEGRNALHAKPLSVFFSERSSLKYAS